MGEAWVMNPGSTHEKVRDAMLLLHFLVCLAAAAQDAPSNDEVMGFVIVFGLIGLVAFIAWAFGPKGTPAPVIVEALESGPSFFKTVLVLAAIVGIIWILYRTGNTPH
jgi:hypothetical protein